MPRFRDHVFRLVYIEAYNSTEEVLKHSVSLTLQLRSCEPYVLQYEGDNCCRQNDVTVTCRNTVRIFIINLHIATNNMGHNVFCNFCTMNMTRKQE